MGCLESKIKKDEELHEYSIAPKEEVPVSKPNTTNFIEQVHLEQDVIITTQKHIPSTNIRRGVYNRGSRRSQNFRNNGRKPFRPNNSRRFNNTHNFNKKVDLSRLNDINYSTKLVDIKPELVSINCSFVQSLLPHYTNNWTRIVIEKDCEPTFLSPVPSNHIDYKVVQSKFGGRSKRMEILKIERVQNPYLLSLYLLKKRELFSKNKDVLEKRLFHGASAEKIHLICRENFNPRLFGRNRGFKYGKGVCFSPFSFYASHYCDRDKTKVMLLCRVLIVQVDHGNYNVLIPDSGFDTTVSEKQDVVVKYDDDVFYPEYKITFHFLQDN